MFEAALGTAVCFILLMTYLNIRRIAGYALFVDIGLFVLFVWLFMGTYAGMMTGIIAGLIVTCFLKGVRKSIGYERLRLQRRVGELYPRIRWVRTRGAL